MSERATAAVTGQPPEREPRAFCVRCLRAQTVCWCGHVVPLETRTHVVILQHRREREVPIGTARMAHLGLPRSRLFVGVDFDADASVREALSAPETYVLFPTEDAVDVSVVRERAAARGVAPTLVVVDGTWWQARALVRRNAVVRALPRVRFDPDAKSRYRIRREPADHCVSTIEAVARVLGELEGDRERFRALLAPFDAMVETQLRFARERAGGRSRHGHAKAVRRARRVPQLEPLVARWDSLLCVHAEANAWAQDRDGGYPHDLVQWVAVRPSTGERFEAVVRPRGPLAPSTTRHTGLSREVLDAGEPVEAFVARWRGFVRETDVLVTWGAWALEMGADAGVAPLPAARLDLRRIAHALLRARSGGVERCAETLGVGGGETVGRGRGGRRAADLVAVARELHARGQREAALRGAELAGAVP